METPSRIQVITPSGNSPSGSSKSFGVQSDERSLVQDGDPDKSDTSLVEQEKFGREDNADNADNADIAALANGWSTEESPQEDGSHYQPRSPTSLTKEKVSAKNSEVFAMAAVPQARPESEVQDAQILPSAQSGEADIPGENLPQPSVVSSPSLLSASDEESGEDDASESIDNQGIVYSGPSSDFGLDGSVFSKQRKDSSGQGTIDETIGPPETGCSQALDKPLLSINKMPKGESDEKAPNAEVDSEDVYQSDTKMNVDHQAGQQRSSMSLPSPDRMASPFPPDNSILEIQGSSTSREIVVPDTIADAEAYLKSIDSQGAPTPHLVTARGQDLKLTHEADSDGAQGVESPRERPDDGHARVQITPRPTQKPNVEIIELESDDDDDQTLPQSAPTESGVSSQRIAEAAQPRSEHVEGFPQHLNDEDLDGHLGDFTGQVVTSNIGQAAGHDSESPGIITNELPRGPRLDDVEQEIHIPLCEQQSLPSSVEKSSRAVQPLKDMIDGHRTEHDAGEETTENKTFPSIELPDTVQDSVKAASTEQLLTPSTTQRASFTSQPSAISLKSLSDDDTLPTPKLTQENFSNVRTPKSPTIPESSPIQPKDDSHQTNAFLRPHNERPTSNSPSFFPTMPQKRQSALVEKLKAMRKQSQQSPKPRLSQNAQVLRPWFEPKRSSQAIPDSEDETNNTSSESEKISTTQREGPTAMATPEKPLAQSFIRSPPERTDLVSTVSSPQYLPPSQPAIGGLRTNLAYFVPLAALPSHFGTLTDVLAIAIRGTTIIRASSGPKDYTQSIYITDPSSSTAKKPITIAQIFRPTKGCFPQVTLGDAILLRDFKVQSFQTRLSLLSTETSAWAVFRPNIEVQVHGPPMEYGAEERGFARGNWAWWASLSENEKERLKASVPREKVSRANGNVKVKKEGINGIGVELPSSQEGRGHSKNGNLWSTQALAREWSTGLDGSVEPEHEEEKPAARRRGLRPRNAKGRVSESPEKEHPPPSKGKGIVKHELTDGTSYADENDAEIPEVGEKDSLTMHELRDGRRYRDRR